MSNATKYAKHVMENHIAGKETTKATFTNNSMSEWLYGEWDETKYKHYLVLNQIPGIHQYMDYLLDYRNDMLYFDRYGMDFTDIYDPRRLRSTSSFGGVVNFISDNVTRLYR